MRCGYPKPQTLPVTEVKGRIWRLLLVEENADMCRLVRTLVEGLTLSISECRDAARALAACTEVQPDWVILDLDLAGMDALAATRQIAAAHPHVRLLVLGEDDARLRQAASRAGAWKYLLKADLIGIRRFLDPMAQESNCNGGKGAGL